MRRMREQDSLCMSGSRRIAGQLFVVLRPPLRSCAFGGMPGQGDYVRAQNSDPFRWSCGSVVSIRHKSVQGQEVPPEGVAQTAEVGNELLYVRFAGLTRIWRPISTNMFTIVHHR